MFSLQFLSVSWNLGVKERTPALSARFDRAIETAPVFVMELIRIVIEFTPYDVLATVTNTAAGGTLDSVKQLGLVIAVVYTSMALIFLLHCVIVLLLGGESPRLVSGLPAAHFAFAFGSRSSSACLPLTIQAMQKLGVPETTANIAGTFGTCIGQNACSGMQPPVPASLVAQVQEMEVWDAAFLIELIIYVVRASMGTAGVGGGPTNVSIMVLSRFALPINLVAVLVSVDFLIDVGRTLVNVNVSILAGLVVAKLEKTIALEILRGNKEFVEEQNCQALLEGAATDGISPQPKVCGLGGTCSINICGK